MCIVCQLHSFLLNPFCFALKTGRVKSVREAGAKLFFVDIVGECGAKKVWCSMMEQEDERAVYFLTYWLMFCTPFFLSIAVTNHLYKTTTYEG